MAITVVVLGACSDVEKSKPVGAGQTPPRSAGSTAVLDDAPPGGEAVPPGSSASTSEGLRGPERYLAMRRRLYEVRDQANRAIDIAVQRCMAERGFEYDPPPRESTETTSNGSRFARAWNSPAPEEAATLGYLPSYPSDGAVLEPETLTPAEYERALIGAVIGSWEVDDPSSVPPGGVLGGELFDGCLPVAQGDIIGAGDQRRSFVLNDLGYWLQRLASDATAAVFASEQWSSLAQRWQRCMAETGYPFSEVREPIAVDWPSPRPGPDEIATAVADASCKQQTAMPSAGDAAFGAAFDQLLEVENAQLDDFERTLDGVVERTADVLAG
jgi:hypothetical protein